VTPEEQSAAALGLALAGPLGGVLLVMLLRLRQAAVLRALDVSLDGHEVL